MAGRGRTTAETSDGTIGERFVRQDQDDRSCEPLGNTTKGSTGEVRHVGDLPDPEPGSREVRVRIRFSSPEGHSSTADRTLARMDSVVAVQVNCWGC